MVVASVSMNVPMMSRKMQMMINSVYLLLTNSMMKAARLWGIMFMVMYSPKNTAVPMMMVKPPHTVLDSVKQSQSPRKVSVRFTSMATTNA